MSGTDGSSTTIPPPTTEAPTATQEDFENLQLAFYIAAGVYAGVIVVLLVIIIVLCVKIMSHKKQLTKLATLTTTQGRSLRPDEELSKRYVMSMDNPAMARSSTMDSSQYRRNPDILRSKNEVLHASGPRHTRKPNELYY